jgi:hypothetical protein
VEPDKLAEPGVAGDAKRPVHLGELGQQAEQRVRPKRVGAALLVVGISVACVQPPARAPGASSSNPETALRLRLCPASGVSRLNVYSEGSAFSLDGW